MATETLHRCEAVTVAEPAGGLDMFDVRNGVPLSAAHDQLYLLMGAALAAMESVADHECGDPSGAWSAVQNMHLACRLHKAIHDGYMAHRRAAKGA